MSRPHTVTYEFRKPEPAPVGRVPRVTRLLALAHTIDRMIRSGEIRNWAEAARLVGVTRARMTQISRLLLLTPQIQEDLLSNIPTITERALRVVAAHVEWQRQKLPRLGAEINHQTTAPADGYENRDCPAQWVLRTIRLSGRKPFICSK